jgi:hypothetical protein
MPTCRVCKSDDLTEVINLGDLYLTGHFPDPDEEIETSPIVVMFCNNCRLSQLCSDLDIKKLYGDNYGYRTGLNASMVDHVASIVGLVELYMAVEAGETDVLDIGANDGTLLAQYPDYYNKVAIDPTIKKFHSYYPENVIQIPSFFDPAKVRLAYHDGLFDAITSIAMFYDLEDPIDFVMGVRSLLKPNGIWIFEQAYMPTIMHNCAYDSLCHEHLEYYTYKNIRDILDKCDMRPVIVFFNETNGGSFLVIACQNDAMFDIYQDAKILKAEASNQFNTISPLERFSEEIKLHGSGFKMYIKRLKDQGATIFGYGASTKGNVLLQVCGIGNDLIDCIAEVNEEKFGKVTPGTNIPIIAESEARKADPDYFVVFPWHFRDNIIQREAKYLEGGGKLIFPLPELEVYG